MLRVPLILAADAKTTSTSKSFLTSLCVTLWLISISSVHQFVNGWLQGVDAYAKGLGKYHNLNKCH